MRRMSLATQERVIASATILILTGEPETLIEQS